MKREKAQVYSWENCPVNVKARVTKIVTFLRESTGENFVGVYLHGSLAMGCFNPDISDIDLLAIVSPGLLLNQKKDIIGFLQQIDNSNAPPEISIVTKESLQNLVYPSPFDLHYSYSTRDVYTSGKISWEEQRFDTDLPAHYMAVRERGICLDGKAINEVFPEIPKEMFMASIVQDLNWIKQEINNLPYVYIVLNPCRALAYVNDIKFLSKQEGGMWALQHVPNRYSTMIERALDAYSGAGMPPPGNSYPLLEFIDYAIKEFIYIASKTDAENLFFKRSY